jgi:lysophospholipase L1-like esterase
MSGIAVLVSASMVVATLTGWATALASPDRALPSARDAPVLYVALGDSTVAGVGASAAERSYVGLLHRRLRTIYPRAALVNLGAPGATSADVRARQLPEAVALRPDLVTLSVGPNDITTGVTVAQYEANLEAVLRALDRADGPLIVVTLLPDLAVTPRFRGTAEEPAVARLSVAFNAALARLSSRFRLTQIDLYAASRREVPARPELVWRDGYHPSDAGYARWAELMWRGMAPRMPALR